MTDPDIRFIARLETIVRERLENGDVASYTVRLATAGTKRIAQKVGEEAVELALAAVAGTEEEVVDEAADLVYHLVVLLNQRGLSMADVAARLQARHED